MAFENNAGIGVHNHYGVRGGGNWVGVERSTGGIHQGSGDVSAKQLQDAYVPPFVIPKGAHFLRALVNVDEAFAGVTDITVGEKGGEATNGIGLVAADLAVGVREPATGPTGTWAFGSATGTTDAKEVNVIFTGTPTAGKGTLVLEYIYKVRTVGT